MSCQRRVWHLWPDHLRGSPNKSHSPFITKVLVSAPLSDFKVRLSWIQIDFHKSRMSLPKIPWTHRMSSFQTSCHSSGRRTGTKWCRSDTWTWKCREECSCSRPHPLPPRWFGTSRQTSHLRWKMIACVFKICYAQLGLPYDITQSRLIKVRGLVSDHKLSIDPKWFWIFNKHLTSWKPIHNTAVQDCRCGPVIIDLVTDL